MFLQKHCSSIEPLLVGYVARSNGSLRAYGQFGRDKPQDIRVEKK